MGARWSGPRDRSLLTASVFRRPLASADRDYGLTEEATTLRREVRHFVENELAPVAAEVDREDRYPAAALEALGE